MYIYVYIYIYGVCFPHYFVVFRQGDVGTNWYAVLSGSLDMNVSETGDSKVGWHL